MTNWVVKDKWMRDGWEGSWRSFLSLFQFQFWWKERRRKEGRGCGWLQGKISCLQLFLPSIDSCSLSAQCQPQISISYGERKKREKREREERTNFWINSQTIILLSPILLVFTVCNLTLSLIENKFSFSKASTHLRTSQSRRSVDFTSFLSFYFDPLSLFFT